jgi:DNA polymerase-3 subunit alpha
MSAVLTHNKNDISKLNFFLQECKRIGLGVLPPDVNESGLNFVVNKKGAIRFGLSALKNLGEGPVEALLADRKENGPFTSVFDMTCRLDSKFINKKVLESLVLGGALDSFEQAHRAQYFARSGKYDTLIEHALRFGASFQDQQMANQNSLFGELSSIDIEEPAIPVAEPWPLIEKLTREKEVTGIFMSGHPLDDYRLEVENFTNCPLDLIDSYKDRKLKIAGIVTETQHRVSKKGTGYGIFTIEDFRGSLEMKMFNEDYKKYKDLFTIGEALYLEGFYQVGWTGGDYTFQPREIRLLSSVGESMTESITLQMPVERVDADFIATLDQVCQRHGGSHKLKLQIFDREDDILLSLVASARRVNADSHFIEEIGELGVKYKLN